MDSNNPKAPKNVLPDLIIPALAVAFTVYYLTTITEVPWISQASAITVSGLLLLAIAALAVRTVNRIRQGSEIVVLGSWPGNRAVNIKRIALLALMVAYVAVIESLGFALTTFIFLFLAIVLLSSPGRWLSAALVALSCSVIGYVVFIYFFKTRFPKGIVENAVQGLF